MFKEGDYIVLVTMHGYCSEQYFINHVYKQSYDFPFLRTELDSNGSRTNGWNNYEFKNTNTYFKWRYATKEEILAYEKAGKPVHISEAIYPVIENNEYLIELFKKLRIN